MPGRLDVRAGVVVIQEWWGLVPHIEDVADRFAALGYVALAPDLYHGKSTVEAEEAHHLMEGLDWGRAAEELAGAVAYLRSVAAVSRVGVVGFCMGGALTVIAAADPGVDAYASFYGFPPAGAVALDRIDAPGLIYFGEHEDAFSVPDAQAFAQQQRERGKQAQLRHLPRRRPRVLQRHAPRGLPAGSSRRRLDGEPLSSSRSTSAARPAATTTADPRSSRGFRRASCRVVRDRPSSNPSSGARGSTNGENGGRPGKEAPSPSGHRAETACTGTIRAAAPID